MRVRIASWFVLALSVLASTAAQAQSWPSRPVTVVVPFAAGVTGDILARSLVEHLSAALGQRKVLAGATDQYAIRMVTHYDVDRSGIDRALATLRSIV